MTSMSSVLTDRAAPPDDTSLDAALGATRPLWDAVLANLEARCERAKSEWKHYGKKHGWQVRVRYRRKSLLYLVPHQGSFLAGMALNAKAMAALDESGLPPELVASIVDGPSYPEGKAARVEVTSPEHVGHVDGLVALKLAAW